MIAARIQANQRGRARAYHAQRYQRWCGMVATKVPRHIFGGEVLSSPVDAPASPSANTTLNTHAIVLGASSLTSAAVRRWRFYDIVPVHTISYRYFPPGCGRSWPERPGSQWCHQVCCRPPRRVEKASRLSDGFARPQKGQCWSKRVWPACIFEIPRRPQIRIGRLNCKQFQSGTPVFGRNS